MAKAKKTTKKTNVEVRDMKAKKNPKGGAYDAFLKQNTAMGDGSVTPSPALNFDVSSLNFKK